MKRIVSLLLVIVLILSPTSCYANTTNTLLESVILQEEELKWEKLENRYYYSRLSENQRNLYDKFYELAIEYFNGELNTVKKNVGTKKQPIYIKAINKTISNKDGIYSYDEVMDLFLIFMFENPQFFFLEPFVGCTKSNQIELSVYESFSTRKGLIKAKKELEFNLRKFIEDVDKNVKLKVPDEISEYVAKKIYNTITYNDLGMGIAMEEDFDVTFTQSIYSALVFKKTVCSGYSKLYSALMNYYGIETISVLSSIHAWNRIKLDENWYNVDLTQCLDYGDYYYMITDKQMFKRDLKFYGSNYFHLLPRFYVDNAKVSEKKYLKTYLPIEEAPKIDYQRTEDGYYLVTISSNNSDAKIKYTINNGDVTEYTEPLKVKETQKYVIRATAKQKGKTNRSIESFLIIE